jgi:predicted TIM-barrel fold metal-dependent hydrolase
MTVLPDNSCDCHAHVFGPYPQFLLAADRLYTPPAAPRANYLQMLKDAGFSRGVLVHGGANGWDHGATLAALRSEPMRLRGIAVPAPTATSAELLDMRAAGIRGVRFTQVIGRTTATPTSGTLNFSRLAEFGPRLRELGWHAQLWANASVVAAHLPQLRALEVPLVLDHMAMIDVAAGIGDASFQSVLRLLREGVAWVKLTAFRNSRSDDLQYSDVRPFHDALIAVNPRRLLWGSDWPFLGMSGESRPSVAQLLRVFGEWAGDQALRQQILSDNPAVLYGFP